VADTEVPTVAAIPTPRQRRWRPGRTLALRSAAIGSLMAVVGFGSQSQMLQAAVTPALPVPLAVALRDVGDAVTKVFSRRIDGMAWIDVDDPRSRRGDKLPRAARASPRP
jgi:hypothetical protein